MLISCLVAVNSNLFQLKGNSAKSQQQCLDCCCDLQIYPPGGGEMEGVYSGFWLAAGRCLDHLGKLMWVSVMSSPLQEQPCWRSSVTAGSVFFGISCFSYGKWTGDSLRCVLIQTCFHLFICVWVCVCVCVCVCVFTWHGAGPLGVLAPSAVCFQPIAGELNSADQSEAETTADWTTGHCREGQEQRSITSSHWRVFYHFP